MKYYIINNRIEKKEALPNAEFYLFTKLSDEQVAFHLANPTASPEEVLNMQLNPVPEMTLEQLKEQKRSEYIQTLYPFVMMGYTDAETNFTLGTTEDDQTKFAILKSGIMDLPDDRIEKFGLMGTGTATLPVADLKELLRRYYLYCKPVWDAKRDVEDAINLATTKEQLENITW